MKIKTGGLSQDWGSQFRRELNEEGGLIKKGRFCRDRGAQLKGASTQTVELSQEESLL